MQIIGFGHRKRVGKDTAVKFAMTFTRQYYPHLQSDVLSFGNELKGIANQMYRWGGLEDAIHYENNSHAIEEILPAIGRSPRQIWDTVGLMGREICPQTWVEMAVLNQSADSDILFSKDVRFPTEIDLIRKFHGSVIRIDRTEAPIGGPVDEALASYDAWDAVIMNNGSLKELRITICSLITRIINKTQDQDKLVCPHCFSRGTASRDEEQYSCSKCEKVM